MNWEAIGAVAEILAAIAVVITLIYLAKQIRQNSQAVGIAALRDTTEQWNRWSEVLANSSELAENVVRAMCHTGGCRKRMRCVTAHTRRCSSIAPKATAC